MISELVSRSIKIVRKDKLVLIPYVCCVLILQSFHSHFGPTSPDKLTAASFILNVVVLGWVVELFFKAVTIRMSWNIHKGDSLEIEKDVGFVAKKFRRLLLSTGIILFPLVGLVKVGLLDVPKGQGLAGFALFILVVPLVLVLEFIPLMVILEDKNVFESIKGSFLFVKRNFLKVIKFSGFIACVMLIAIIFAESLGTVPVIGDSVLKACVTGVGYGFMYVMTVVFYVDLCTDSEKASQNIEGGSLTSKED
ncbi:MAG: hypothetical protein ACI9BD_001501 [Candidatus Marinamargulisbacteria bacterium]|jgi:hypothetical protein